MRAFLFHVTKRSFFWTREVGRCFDAHILPYSHWALRWKCKLLEKCLDEFILRSCKLFKTNLAAATCKKSYVQLNLSFKYSCDNQAAQLNSKKCISIYSTRNSLFSLFWVYGLSAPRMHVPLTTFTTRAIMVRSIDRFQLLKATQATAAYRLRLVVKEEDIRSLGNLWHNYDRREWIWNEGEVTSKYGLWLRRNCH